MKYFAVILTFICSFAFASTSAPATGNESPVMPVRGICAHRGEQKDFPENTVPAFLAAVERGAHEVEFDVGLTRDGKMVVMHDLTVDRTTNGKGKITELTFDEIRALDAGSWKSDKFKGTKVPTFDEAIDCLPRNIWINIHLKSGKGLAAMVAKKVKEKNRTHQAFLACQVAQIQEARQVVPEIKFCNMSRQGGSSEYVRLTIENKSDFIQIVYRTQTKMVDGKKVVVSNKQYNKEDIAKLKKAGVKINCFGTRNSVTALREMYEDGVDFPLVDYTEEMLETAKEFGITPWSPQMEKQ